MTKRKLAGRLAGGLAGPRVLSRARTLALLSATALAGLPHAAEAARFGVVVNAVPDPLLTGLTIPDTAPAQGMWSGLKPWPMNAVHLGLLPSGRVVSFGTAGGNPYVQDGRTFDTWDPYRGLAQDSHMTIAGVSGVNSFCAAQSLLSDGSLLVAGGIFDNGNDRGSVVLNARTTGIAASPARLANDRYYATMLTLPNGQPIILGGSFPYLGGWADPQGSIDQGYMTGMTPEIYDGTRWRSLLGAKSRDAFGPDFNRFWYPRAWVAPDGRVFGISSEKMWYLNTAGNGSVTAMPFGSAQRDVGSSLDAPNVGPASTAVMYATGKILQVGGNAYSNGEGFLSSSRATLIDINGGTPAVAETAPMSTGRGWPNATVLPTGHVAVTGGSRFNDRGDGDVVLQSEIWNPATGRWSVGASGAVYRGYHSSAVLLQNGALLVAGGGAPGPVSNENAELFYPPYLFASVNGQVGLAQRPQIVSLSTLQLQHGQSMQFELSSPNGLSQVVLIGLSLTTHSFNVGQRRYVAAFQQPDQQTVSLRAPATAGIAPPGYYQLVAIDRNGVPSAGVIVSLGANVAAPSQVAAPAAPAGQVAGGGSGGTGTGGGTGGTGTGGTGGTGTGTGTGTVVNAATGAPMSLQSSNYTASYLMNVAGSARLVAPASAADRRQSTFRQVAGLAGQGVSFLSTVGADQYLRHQNFMIWQQTNDGSDLFKRGATFNQRAGLAGSCGCNTGACVAYESIDWPGYYLRHQNFAFSIAKPDGGVSFNQDASFCLAPPLDGGATADGAPLRAAHSGLCLSVPAGNTNDGAPVTQQACTGAAEQTWRRVAGTQGTAYVNKASGKCLDASLLNGPIVNGTQIFQWVCHGGANQVWTARPQGAGNALVSAASNLCLDVFGFAPQAGAATVVWACHGGANQTFTSAVVTQ